MKKLFLTVAFLLISALNLFALNDVNSKEVSNYDLNNLTITSITPNIINLEDQSLDTYDCFQAADQGATALGYIFELSYYEEYLLFNALYDACEANQEEEQQ